jgi:hypothetical protein
MNLRQRSLIESIATGRQRLAVMERVANKYSSREKGVPTEVTAAITRVATVIENLEVELATESTSF